MDGMNVKSLEERSEGDVASPSSTGTQVQSLIVSRIVNLLIWAARNYLRHITLNLVFNVI